MKRILIIVLSILLLFTFASCKKKGIDGKTPYIQDGYWYIDGVNTGVKAEGVDGANGINGKDGTDGKDGKDGKDGISSAEGSLLNDNQGLAFYPQDDGTYVVGGGNAKYMKNLVIPEKYYGGDVVAIEENAFKDFTNLETIVIPDSVKKLGQGIFAGCKNLMSISMPCYEDTPRFMWLCTDASVSSISSDDEIFIPPVNTINITGDAIPQEMFYFWSGAGENFASTLKTLTISDSITSIGAYAFYHCSESLFEEENGIKYLGKWAIACTDVNFVLREDTIGIAGYALVRESGGDFDESVTKFTIPASIKYISPMALLVSPYITEYEVESGNTEYCVVDGVVYTKDMKTLVQYPMAKEQQHFTFPEKVEHIFPYAFFYSIIESVTLPDNMTEISSYAFAESGINKITLSSTVTKLGVGAFAYASLSEINLPEGITEIPAFAFDSTNLSGIIIPSTVTKIGEHAFSYSDIKTITLPEGITEIADNTFYSCDKLVSVYIPDSVTKIGNSAFAQSDNLLFVHLPKKLTSIGDSAFESTGLLSINVPKKLSHIGNNAFNGCNIIEVVNEDNWNLNIYEGSSGNGYIAYHALEVHSGESKIVNVDDYLFYSYSNTNYLVRYIGNDTELHLPESYNGQEYEIYREAFFNRNTYYNNPIYKVVIPDCVTKIGDLAFYGCEELTEIVIGDKVTSFGSQAFDYCHSLEKVYYKGTETMWNRITHSDWYFNYIQEAPRYYYSETKPTQAGQYWHYVDGMPTIWE